MVPFAEKQHLYLPVLEKRFLCGYTFRYVLSCDRRLFMKLFTRNRTPKELLINALLASVGLFFFGIGTFLIIRANWGASPWDVFNLGLSKAFGILYGNASIAVSAVLLLTDWLLGESIGFGLILDAVIVGKTVDLLNWLDPVPYSDNPLISVIMLLAGTLIEVYSMFFYMKAALGCGPRDTLLVGLKRKMIKIPISAINILIMATVTLIGYLLGGQVGIGTLFCAFCTGPILQFAFRTVSFDPTAVTHQSIPETLRVLFRRHS